MASNTRRYNSARDDSNVIVSVEPHNETVLWEFTDGRTYYIAGKDDYSVFIDLGYRLERQIPRMRLKNYIIATYLNGDKWIVKKEDITEEFLKTAEIITKHNDAVYEKGVYGKALIYARTSTKAASSIEAQIGICKKYTLDNHLELYPFGIQYDENISSRNMKNLDHELGYWSPYLEDNSHLIVANVDRLSRNIAKGVEFINELLGRGITIHFVNEELILTNNDDYGHGERIYQLLVAAEEYSNTISLKARANKRYHMKRREEKTAANKQDWIESHELPRKKLTKRIPIKKIKIDKIEKDDILLSGSSDEDDSSEKSGSSIGTKVQRLETTIADMKSTMADFTSMMQQFRGFTLNTPASCVNSLAKPVVAAIEVKKIISAPAKKSSIPVLIAPSKFKKADCQPAHTASANRVVRTPSRDTARAQPRFGLSHIEGIEDEQDDFEHINPPKRKK